MFPSILDQYERSIVIREIITNINGQKGLIIESPWIVDMISHSPMS